jgi:hypothetical protein
LVEREADAVGGDEAGLERLAGEGELGLVGEVGAADDALDALAAGPVQNARPRTIGVRTVATGFLLANSRPCVTAISGWSSRGVGGDREGDLAGARGGDRGQGHLSQTPGRHRVEVLAADLELAGGADLLGHGGQQRRAGGR